MGHHSISNQLHSHHHGRRHQYRRSKLLHVRKEEVGSGGRIKTKMHTLNLGDVEVVNFAFVLCSLLFGFALGMKVMMMVVVVVLLVVVVAMVMARKTFPNALYSTTPDHPLHGGNWW